MDPKDLTWENVEIDNALPAVLPMTTKPHVDLTKTWDKLHASPQQYVWVSLPSTPHDHHTTTSNTWPDDEQDEPNDLTTHPLDAVEIASLRTTHRHLLNHFLRIYHVARPNTPYLRWEFSLDGDELARIWELLHLTPWVREHFDEHKTALLARLQPVFVERHNGLHFGRWAHDLGMRQARKKGLFVQMFGALNQIPCRCCEESYRRSTSVLEVDVTGFGDIEKKRAHVIWPFFGCVSYEPVGDGRCGNCWWSDKQCSWTEIVEGYPAWPARATENGPRIEGKLIKAGRGDLIPADWEGAIKAQEERYKAGQRRKSGKGRKFW